MYILVDQDLLKKSELMNEPKRRACLPGTFAIFVIEGSEGDYDSLTKINTYNEPLEIMAKLDDDILKFI